MGIGNLEIATRTRHSVKNHQSNLYAEGASIMEFDATVKFKPVSTGSNQAVVAARLRQQATRNGFECIQPTLTVHAMIPHDSPVLEMIIKGDMAGFMHLLNKGKASIWDRDAKTGASPLCVSILSNYNYVNLAK